MTKMNRCGIQGKTLDWFKSYLTNRIQRCFVDSLSNFTTLTCSVPKVKILGPLLFRIYINDFPSCVSFSVPRMSADDTRHITSAGSDLHLIYGFLVSKETVVLRRWERSKQKFGFIKPVDKG